MMGLKRLKNPKGVSFIEILIATTIVLLVSIAVIQTFLMNLTASELNRGNTVALMHLTSMVERIKLTPFNTVPTLFPDGDVNGPASNDYEDIVGGYTLDNESITVTYVDPLAEPLETVVTLNWTFARTGQNRTNTLVTKRTR